MRKNLVGKPDIKNPVENHNVGGDNNTIYLKKS
jgi:hypothetical protein